MKASALARPFSLVLVFFLIVPLLAGTLQAEVERPNVVLFLVDDMGWMDSGVYGSEYYETPRIDAFAERAMRFTNASIEFTGKGGQVKKWDFSEAKP